MSLTATSLPFQTSQRFGIFVPSSRTAPTRPRHDRLGRTATDTPEAPNVWHFVWDESIQYTWASHPDALNVYLIGESERNGTEAVRTLPVRTLETDLEHIMAAAQHEDFEVGMCSQFE